MLTRSQVDGWEVTHLEELASHFGTNADGWREGFARVAKEAQFPGGSDWWGAGGEAAQAHTAGLQVQAHAAADALDAVAAAASAGAAQIHAAKRVAQWAISSAEDEGFWVTEELQVFAPVGSDQAQAAGHQLQIQGAAEDLERVDTEVGRRISDGISAVDFTTAPVTAVDENGHPVDVSDGKLPPAPAGKEWHYYATWGWRLEAPLEQCSGAKEFWLGAGIAGAGVGTVFGGPVGAIGGIPAMGAGINDLEHCDGP